LIQKKIIIVTGHTGFVGSNLIRSLNDYNVLLLDRYFFDNGNRLFDLGGNQITKEHLQGKEIIFIHLATYFSTKSKDDSLIYDCNIAFSLKVLEFLSNFNLKKIIYTNSMFNFYIDKKLRNSYYSKTKMDFSNILNLYCVNNDCELDEIYLDNNFGLNDKRKKIIPEIISSINNSKKSPIKNPENFINIVHIDDVILRIKHSINKNDKHLKTSFVNSQSYNLNSIFLFLRNFKKKNIFDESLLLTAENKNYVNYPKNMYNKFENKNIPIELTKLIT